MEGGSKCRQCHINHTHVMFIKAIGNVFRLEVSTCLLVSIRVRFQAPSQSRVFLLHVTRWRVVLGDVNVAVTVTKQSRSHACDGCARFYRGYVRLPRSLQLRRLLSRLGMLNDKSDALATDSSSTRSEEANMWCRL